MIPKTQSAPPLSEEKGGAGGRWVARSIDRAGMMGRMKLGYRPELDGLRAVAVTLVFLYHAGAVVPGGWMGVDLFFVLSGYLITRLLLEEHALSGVIDLRAFWMRRARRLLPAAAVVVALAWVVNGAGSWGWVLAYASNWANVAGREMPWLGHFWSLAIEEQFYLVWPVLLLALLRARVNVLGACVALAGAVTVWRVVAIAAGFDTTRIHVGSDTRADVLLIGAALAVWHHRGRLVPVWTAAVGIVVLAVVASSGTAPGGSAWTYSAVALSGATVVSWAVQSAPRVLRWGPAVHLGRRSYGVYLWHVPVLAVLTDALLAAVVSVLLAELSARYVEARFRSRRFVEPAAADEVTAAPHDRVVSGERHRVSLGRVVGQEHDRRGGDVLPGGDEKPLDASVLRIPGHVEAVVRR